MHIEKEEKNIEKKEEKKERKKEKKQEIKKEKKIENLDVESHHQMIHLFCFYLHFLLCKEY